MDIVEYMRGFAEDHEPDGWPAVKMSQITALCDEIDRLRAEVAELRKDADRLELLASRGASIVKCRDGYYLYWHTSNRAGPTMPTARSAIDAALAKGSSHE